MKEKLYDNKGKEYEIKYFTYDSGVDIELRYNGKLVGEVKSNIEDQDVWILEDILIYDDSANSSRGFVTRMLDTVNHKKAKNYRRRGLGTELLKYFIEYARSKNVTYIYGSIMPDDLLHTPHLLAWYKSHGFKECKPYKNCVPGAATYICLRLP
jgi:GNAT superfamily N-acetyltransferase